VTDEGDPLAPLRAVDHWVEWGVDDPESKRPYSPTRGHATGHDPEKEDQWGSYDDVESGKRGFVVTGTNFWGIDLDDVQTDGEDSFRCLKDEDHECDIDLAEKVARVVAERTYIERSPSGEGYHAIAEQRYGTDDWSHKGEHVEVYTTGRYFTVTEDEVGEVSAGDVRPVPLHGVRKVVENHSGSGEGPSSEGGLEAGDVEDEVVLEALEHVDRELDYHSWLDVLYALHSWDPSEEGMEAAMEWSRQSPKYDGEGGETETQVEWVWANADPDGDVTVATLFHHAMENGWEPPPGAFGPDWGSVRAAFRDDEVSGVTARDRAFRALEAGTEFLAMKDTENLWRYSHAEGVFVQDGEQYVGSRLEDEIGPFYTRNLKDELIDRLKSANWAERDELGASLSRPLVACENRVVDLQTGETLEHSPEHRLMSKIPVEHDPDAECRELEEFLRERLEGDEDRIDSVWEAMACALAPGLPVDNFVILHGPPGTGKSTLIKVIERLVGEENAASEGLHRLAHDNHAMAGLYGKKANLAGDMDGNVIRRTRLLLQLSGGDTVTANPKHETPFQFEPTAEMVFSTNELPEFESNLDPIARRLVPIEVPVEIPREEHEPMHEVMARLASDGELSGALNRAIEAYSRLLDQTEFSVNHGKSLEERRQQYKLLEDPVEGFLQALAIKDPAGEVPKDRVYKAYRAWAERMGAKPLDKGQLTSRLTERDHIETSRPTAQKVGLGDRSGRVRCYHGIMLNADGEAAAEAMEERDEEQRPASAPASEGWEDAEAGNWS
jgi:P4 family phage/plasmid primase-like protien